MIVTERGELVLEDGEKLRKPKGHKRGCRCPICRAMRAK